MRAFLVVVMQKTGGYSFHGLQVGRSVDLETLLLVGAMVALDEGI